MEEDKVETAENPNNNGSTSIAGALKSQSSFENESNGNAKINTKRQSAVRFADQIDQERNSQPSRISAGVTVTEEDESVSDPNRGSAASITESKSKKTKTGSITIDSPSGSEDSDDDENSSITDSKRLAKGGEG